MVTPLLSWLDGAGLEQIIHPARRFGAVLGGHALQFGGGRVSAGN